MDQEELTREDYIKLHRELWDWLSKHPGKSKRDWLGWKEYGLYADNDCFACEACKEYRYKFSGLGAIPSGRWESGNRCSECPLVWGDGPDDTCEERFVNGNWEAGYFSVWVNIDVDMRRLYAEIIRDLPVREEP